MKREEVRRILEVRGFNVGKLPFRYLGVPISHKKIFAKECQPLIDKKTARVRV